MKALHQCLDALETTVARTKTATHSLTHSLADLFIPSRWTRSTLHSFLNAPSLSERETLTSDFVTSTLSTMSTTGLTARLPFLSRSNLKRAH